MLVVLLLPPCAADGLDDDVDVVHFHRFFRVVHSVFRRSSTMDRQYVEITTELDDGQTNAYESESLPRLTMDRQYEEITTEA